jgi:hypothetical protein
MPSGKPGSGMKFGDKCKDCGFPVFSDNAIFKGNYLQTRCKTCYSIYSNNFPSRTKEARHTQWLNWKFGISKEEYNTKLINQFNGCAICKQLCETRENLAVDHDHQTNAIRDLLCHRCNTVLGMIHDNEILLIDMIEYLKRHARKTA